MTMAATHARWTGGVAIQQYFPENKTRQPKCAPTASEYEAGEQSLNGSHFSRKGFTAMDLPDFLTQDDGGYVHVAGHRVGLGELVFFYKQGDSPEMLHARFPTIALPLFYKVIAYYLENQLAVDEYCGRQAEEMARQRAAARSGPNLDDLRKRRRGDQLAQGA
jgi:hypothetical protein